MGSKNSPTKKSKFEKLCALLADPDMLDVQWPLAVDVAKTAAEFDALEALVPAKVDDLFYGRLALVTDVPGAIALAQKYPNQKNRIYRKVTGFDPISEQQIYQLVEAFPDWKEDLLTDLFERKSEELTDAVDALADAEDALTSADLALSETAAETYSHSEKAREILQKAQEALDRALILNQALSNAKGARNAAEEAYENQAHTVDELQISVQQLNRQLNETSGALLSMLPEMTTEDQIKAQEYIEEIEEVAAQRQVQVPDRFTVSADQNPAPAGSDTHVAQTLKKSRARRLIDRFVALANSPIGS